MVTGHYLRHNASEWSPARLIFLDTESRQEPTEAGRLHTLRVACGAFVHRRKARPDGTPWAESITTADPGELWTWAAEHTSGAESTWVYAHNLAFDLCVSQAMVELPRLGWEVTDFSTLPRTTYVRWFRHARTCDRTCRDPAKLRAGGRACHGRRLVMADSASLLPASIDRIGRLLGLSSELGPGDSDLPSGRAARARDLAKLPMPADDDGLERWTEYCRRDVEILAEAVLTLLEWWDSEHLGHWAITGPGCGWSALRHRWLTERILVHDDPEATELERAAYFGGRREVYRVGEVEGGPFPYLDLEHCYVSMAEREGVPVRLLRVVEEPDFEALLNLPPDLGAIAEVEVDDARALVPVRTERGVAYPVGPVRTTLPGPELHLLRAQGVHVRVVRAAVYRLSPALREWARWIIGLLDDQSSPRARIVGLMAKGWSHSVLGKFGQVGRTKRRLHPTLPTEHSTIPIIDVDSGTRRTLTHLGGWAWLTIAEGEPDNAVPAIAAWITSAARVELWRLMEAAGKERVLWCDTDGMIIQGPPAPDPTDYPDPPSSAYTSPPTEQDGPTATAAEPCSTPTLGRCTPEMATTAPSARSNSTGLLPWRDDPDAWLWPGWSELVTSPLKVKAVYQRVSFTLPGVYKLDGRDVIKGLPAGRQEVSPGAFRYELWPSLGVQLAAHHGRAFETWTRTATVGSPYTRGRVLDDGRVLPLRINCLDGRTVIEEDGPCDGRVSRVPNPLGERAHSLAERAGKVDHLEAERPGPRREPPLRAETEGRIQALRRGQAGRPRDGPRS